MSAELLGRDTELAALRTALEEARLGQARVALVCGDAGIGKTSVVEALADAADACGFRVAWGRCWEGGGAAPFWPWVQVLRSCLAGMDDDQRAALVGDSGRDLAHLLPELGVATHAGDTPDGRLKMFDAVVRVLHRSATPHGLLVALDDLHAADEASLHLMRYVARTHTLTPIFLVGTYRVAEVVASPLHQTLLGAVSRHGATMRLSGLDPESASALLHRVRAGVTASKAGKVHSATSGNPFLVCEAARLLSEGRGDEEWVALPAEARALVARRLQALPSDVASVLASGALLGRELTLGSLSRLTARPPDDILDALAEAARLDLLEETGLGRWSFTHGLLREVLVEGLPAGERAQLHRKAGELLSEDAGSEPSQVAHHLFAAATGGEHVAAVEACVRAAESATGNLAHEEAILWLRRALDAMDLSGAVDERRRYDLLYALGDSLVRRGTLADAQEAFHRAIKSAQALGSVELAAEAAVEIAPHAISDPVVIGALDDALCDLPEEDSPLRARVLVSFARVMQNSSLGRKVLHDVNHMGLAMARRIGDPGTVWATLWQWHQNGFNGIEAVGDRLQVAQELVAVAAEAGDRERVALARAWLAVDLFESGDLTGARAELGAVLRDAEELRQPFLSWVALCFAAQLSLFEGRLDEAEALANQAYEAGSDCQTVMVEVVLYQQRAALRRHQGRFEELEQLASEASSRWTTTSYDCRQNIRLIGLVGSGRADEARAQLDALFGNGAHPTLQLVVPDAGSGHVAKLCCPTGMADVLWSLGASEYAQPLYETLLSAADRHVLVGEAESRGACALYLGQLATLLGRLDEADAHFRAAHELHGRFGARVWAAHGRVDHARMLVQRGGPEDRARAASLLTEARYSYRAMGMEFYEGRASTLLDELEPRNLERARLSQEGEYWVFEYRDDLVRLRDGKGVRFLVELLRHPGMEVHAVDLVDEAVADAERARQSVTRAIRAAVERLAQAHPALGDHLRSAVRTGVMSAYVPDPRAPIRWDG